MTRCTHNRAPLIAQLTSEEFSKILLVSYRSTAILSYKIYNTVYVCVHSRKPGTTPLPVKYIFQYYLTSFTAMSCLPEYSCEIRLPSYKW